MTVTELVILNLKHKQTNAELRKNGPYIKCLETVKRQKGCLGVTWGVTLEDPGKVVWFVEWKTMKQHTEGFMKSDEYQGFKDSLESMTSIDTVEHYNMSSSPSNILSSGRPIMEVFSLALKDGTSHDSNERALQPLLDAWKQEGRQYTMGRAMDKENGQKLLLLVPWQSTKEHEDYKQKEAFKAAIGAAKPNWGETTIYSHIEPSV